jgi:hypothetical protein
VQRSNFTLLCSELYAFVAQAAALWQRSRDQYIVRYGGSGFPHDALVKRGVSDRSDALERLKAKWIRFAVRECGKAKGRADFTSVETALKT